jgi:hypothetical protein
MHGRRAPYFASGLGIQGEDDASRHTTVDASRAVPKLDRKRALESVEDEQIAAKRTKEESRT